MPRELSPDAAFLDTRAAALWASAIPLNRDVARPIATWCTEQMRVPPQPLPSLPALRALCRDDGLWLAALMSNVSDRAQRTCGLFLMQPDTPIAETIGARGFIPLTRRVKEGRRDDATSNAMIVIGLPYALAIAGASGVQAGQLIAVPDTETLLAIELPGELRCLVIANPGGDTSFGDGPVIARAVRRFRQEGRRVKVVGEAHVR